MLFFTLPCAPPLRPAVPAAGHARRSNKGCTKRQSLPNCQPDGRKNARHRVVVRPFVTRRRGIATFWWQKVTNAVCDSFSLPLFGRRSTAVFARRGLCTFWPQKVPKTFRRMPSPASSRLTFETGAYSRGRTRPGPVSYHF